MQTLPYNFRTMGGDFYDAYSRLQYIVEQLLVFSNKVINFMIQYRILRSS